MDHRTIMGFRRDDDAPAAQDRPRRRCGGCSATSRPYRSELIGFVRRGDRRRGRPRRSRRCCSGASSTPRSPTRTARSSPDLALAAVGLAFANAVLSLVQRWYSARIGEGLIYDLRVAAVRPRAAHADRVLHPHADRRAAVAAQQRRHRRAAGGHEHARHRAVRTSSARRDADDHVRARLAAHAPDAARAARVHLSRRAGSGRALQKLTREGMQQNAEMNNITAERFNVAGALRREAVRPARPRARRVRAPRRRACATSASRPRCTAGCCSSRSASSPRSAPRSSTSSVATSRCRARSTPAPSPRSCSTSARSTNRSRSSRTRASTCSPRSSRSSGCSRCSTSRRRSPTSRTPIDARRRPRAAIEFDHVWFRHPPGRDVSLASLEAPGTPGGDGAERLDPARRLAHGRAGRDGRARRPVGRGQDDDRDARAARLRRRRGRGARRRSRRARPHARLAARRGRARRRRTRTCSTTRSAPTCASRGPTRPTPSSSDALQAARIWDLVASLPDGLDTVVGERGYRMSGGEKQRLAIARAAAEGPARS